MPSFALILVRQDYESFESKTTGGTEAGDPSGDHVDAIKGKMTDTINLDGEAEFEKKPMLTSLKSFRRKKGAR